jgi:hypothetical protein
VFDRATQAAVDLAAAGFGSATSNAQSLGRALEDPIRGLTSLTRQGVTFTAEQQELIKSLVESNRTLEAQGIILGAIETQVGGVAEATANGSARIAQSFGILRDRIALELGPAFEFLVAKALEFVERFADYWDRNGDDIIQSFRDFARSVQDTWQQFRDFAGQVRDNLLRGDALPALLSTLRDLREQFRNTRDAANRFFDSISAGSTEQKASLFARYVEFYFIKPLDRFASNVSEVLGLIERFLDAAARLGDFFSGRGVFGGNFGGAIELPPDFVPGSVAPTGQRPTTVVNVTGAIDPEGTARVIRRTLDAQALRTGQVPTPGIAQFQ